MYNDEGQNENSFKFNANVIIHSLQTYSIATKNL